MGLTSLFCRHPNEPRGAGLALTSFEVHDWFARIANDHIASICGSVPNVSNWAWLKTLTNLRRKIGSVSWARAAFTICVDGVLDWALVASIGE